VYASQKTIRVIKSRRVRGFGHIARIGKMRITQKVLVLKPEGKRQLGSPFYR
jgi:hypothetical protein